jgi:hypothetical protein
MIEITTSTGQRKIHLGHFAALDGWDIQHRFLAFAASNDKVERRTYVMEVLSYARVEIQGASDHIPLTTAALINNHLESWKNIEAVFNGILLKNGIDPETHATKTRFWADAGEEMAMAFIAACSSLIKPAMEFAEEQYGNKQG